MPSTKRSERAQRARCHTKGASKASPSAPGVRPPARFMLESGTHHKGNRAYTTQKLLEIRQGSLDKCLHLAKATPCTAVILEGPFACSSCRFQSLQSTQLLPDNATPDINKKQSSFQELTESFLQHSLGNQNWNCILGNVRSLPKHAVEIWDLLSSKLPDIGFLTETWLKPSSTPAIALALPEG